MSDTYPAAQNVFDLHQGDYDFMPFYIANFFRDRREDPELAIRQRVPAGRAGSAGEGTR